MNDIFFKLPRSKAEKVIREAINISKSVVVDELDCAKSWCRQPTTKTTEEVFTMGIENKDTMWHFIIRHWSNSNPSTDIGLSTMPIYGVSYFLWINLEIDAAYKLAEKYKLKRHIN